MVSTCFTSPSSNQPPPLPNKGAPVRLPQPKQHVHVAAKAVLQSAGGRDRCTSIRDRCTSITGTQLLLPPLVLEGGTPQHPSQPTDEQMSQTGRCSARFLKRQHEMHMMCNRRLSRTATFSSDGSQSADTLPARPRLMICQNVRT